MASLLGGEYCICSLRRDARDLQAILDEVPSRVGLVEYQSWKFPDKASCDVDIHQILERCQYNENDEEECQMAHVMLYDIVIDRLVYLLQSFTCFNEVLLNVGNVRTSPSLNKGGNVKSMSIGLTVKKCWGRITQIAGLLQKLAKEAKARSDQETSEVYDDDDSKNFHTKTSSASLPPTQSVTQSQNSSVAEKDVSRDNRSTGCQTVETAYINCESCFQRQSCLYGVGRSISDLCKRQNLPTALEDYLMRCNEEIPMSVAEMVRWGKHQSKDLSRISRHMTSLVNQVTPLKKDLATALKNLSHANSQLEVCQSVSDQKEEELRDEFRRREYKLTEVEKDLKKKISSLENVKTSIQKEVDECRWKASELKDDLLQKHRDQLSMENAMSQLKEEAVEGRQYKQDALKFKAELSRVNTELENLQQSIHLDQKLYEKERAKNENIGQREKILQEKQRMLITRMDVINEECEKLRENIFAVEEERDAALSKLRSMEKKEVGQENTSQKSQLSCEAHNSELDLLHENVKFLREENEKLKLTVSEYTERERLIVAYPDLNQSNVTSPMVQGSGDVFSDMRNQIEANKIRVLVLEKENSALLKTLQRVNSSLDNYEGTRSRLSCNSTMLSSMPESVALQERIIGKHSQPVQLWKISRNDCFENFGKQETENDISGVFANSDVQNKMSTRQNYQCKAISGHSNKPHRQQDIPEVDGTRSGVGTPSSLETYKKMKQQKSWSDSRSAGPPRPLFTVGSGRRAKSGRTSSAKSEMFKPWT